MKIVLLAVVLAFAAPRAYADATASSAPTLKLVEAGKDPKTQLRLAGKKGAKKKMTMLVGMSIATKAAGADNKITIPPIEMSLDMKLADVATNGDLTIDMTFGAMKLKGDATTPKAMVDTFAKIAKGIKGAKGHLRMSNRAFTQEVSIDVPPSAPKEVADLLNNMKQTLSQISAPLPEEAVGVGAKWETTSMVTDANGIELEQVAMNEVTAIKGKVTTIKVVVNQSAKPKKVTLKGMPFDLKSLKGGGAGAFNYDAAIFIPVSGAMSVSTTVTLDSSGQTIASTVDLTMSLTSR